MVMEGVNNYAPQWVLPVSKRFIEATASNLEGIVTSVLFSGRPLRTAVRSESAGFRADVSIGE